MLDASEIIPELLWVGSAPTRDDIKGLKDRFGSRFVILDLTRNPAEEAWCRELSVAYEQRIPRLEDNGQPIPLGRLRLIALLIEKHVNARRKIFMHCTAGRGRSPTCAAAYLIHGGMSVSEARKYVSDKRLVWTSGDCEYANSLDDFAKMQEITRLSE